jgi:hypothetical protein
MNSTLANDAVEHPPIRSMLETWGKNERMRHVPSADWILWKVDVDLRRRIERLLQPFATLSADDPRRAALESEFRALGKAIDRFADTIRHSRPLNNTSAEPAARLNTAMGHAVSCLNTLDANLFGRRYPFQTFERSKAEPLYGALLVVIRHIDRIVPMVRQIDSGIDERLFEGLVKLSEPLREQPMA